MYSVLSTITAYENKNSVNIYLMFYLFLKLTWLYGPIAAGADTVFTIFLQTSLPTVGCGET